MDTEPTASISKHFASLEGPRLDRTKLQQLLDIHIIAICASICGADDWVEVELFGKAKLAWLRTFLELPNGIPSYDTFGRVFARLNAERFQACFMAWIQAVSEVTGGQVIAIDGKVLRGSCSHPASTGDSCRDRQPAADRVQVVKGMHGLLGALKAQGLLTDEEFAAQKAKLLGM